MTDVAEGPLPDAVVRYADHPDGLLDVHLPAGVPRGTVVLVHGGFWRAEWDRKHTRRVARALSLEGFVVLTPEYRRTGADDDRAGGWPQTYDDVRAAVTRAPGLLAGLALPGPRPWVAVGHSAGGHLALLLAADLGAEGTAGKGGPVLDRVVALAPVGDLRDAERRDLDAGAVRALLGGSSVELPELYDEADPAVRLDPATKRCPVVVLHGDLDVQVPLATNDWARARPDVEVRVLEGADHFALIDTRSAAWPEVRAAVLEAGGPPD